MGRRRLSAATALAAAVAACAALATGCAGTPAKPAGTAAATSTPAAIGTPAATATGSASATARVVATRRTGPREVDLTVRSPALDATAHVRLLTPDGWRQGGARHWPVLYLLPGCCSSYRAWTEDSDVARTPALRRVLVVMPDGGEVGFYSDWKGGTPGWETFHTRELPALLEHDYGAGGRRAIAGLSMGGLGAMAYAARHPGMFKAAASFSGALHPLQHPDFWLGLFGSYTSDPTAIWGDPDMDPAGWRAHDPTALAGRLRGTALFVSAGNGRPGPLDHGKTGRDDIEPTVGAESQAFVAGLKRAHIAVRSDFYGPGTHDWPYWQRELHRALPLLLGPLT